MEKDYKSPKLSSQKKPSGFRPYLASIKTQQPFLTDLHVHSNFSDGQLSIPEVVDTYGKRGFGAIAITDHLCEEGSLLGKAAHCLDYTLTQDNFSLYKKILETETKRAWDQYKMVVIPGFEITKNRLSNHRSAHILALGVDQYLSADGEISDLARSIREAGGTVVAAHPVSTRRLEKQTYHLWDRRDELAHAFDAWEVASGPHWFAEVAQSRLPLLATSGLSSALANSCLENSVLL